VEAGLRLLVETHAQTGIRRLRGKVKWHGDLNEPRQIENSAEGASD
jgi:hypothetical protein